MNERDILETIGFNKKEVLLYRTLLAGGRVTVAKLAQQSKLHRPTVYATLAGLEKKGLVTRSLKGKRMLYRAESPEKLEKVFEDIKQRFEETLPQLKEMHQGGELRPIVKFLEGKEGITFVLEDIVNTLKKGDIFYRYSSATDSARLEQYLPKNYRERRDKKRLERFVITNEVRLRELEPRLERAVKTIPKEHDLFTHNITQIIYADKVAFIDYNTETVLLVENKKMAEFQRKLFKLMYKLL